MYHIIFIHSSADGHLDCFHILTVGNNAVINTGVHISCWNTVFISFAYKPRSGIAEAYDRCIFNFLRNLYIVFHSGWTNWHSHHRCIKVPFSPHLCQHLLSLVFLIIAILTGVSLYITLVSICIFLVIGAIEHLLMCLLAILLPFLEKCLFSCSAHF